jgi:hypothetical protein
VRFAWPIARVAAIPLLKGGRYSNTRLLPLSATHRAPLLSKVTPRIWSVRAALFPRVLALMPTGQFPVLKFGCPNTRLALMPLLNGG